MIINKETVDVDPVTALIDEALEEADKLKGSSSASIEKRFEWLGLFA